MLQLVYPPEQPCGCGSGRPFGTCCLKDGGIRLAPKPAQPSGPRSGFSNRKCFFAADGNCCPKISGDHIISRSVLKVLTTRQVTISTASITRSHSIDSSSLKTKRLCRRHNSWLSGIDHEAARFFQAFAAINSALNGGPRMQRLVFFNGMDIERWLLKTMVMAFHAGLTDINPRTARLPLLAAECFSAGLPRPTGLYMKTRADGGPRPHFATESAVTVSLRTLDGVLASGIVGLGGLELHLLLRSPTAAEAASLSHRPKRLIFFRGDEVYSIWLAWSDGGESDIAFSHSDPDAPVPSGIFGPDGRFPDDAK